MAGAVVGQLVRQPYWTLDYKGEGLRGKIEKMVLSVIYTDFESGQSPDLEIILEDRDKRWQDKWFPRRGDTLYLKMGYLGEVLVPCGTFQIDEVELDWPPDSIKMKCLNMPITPDARTPATARYENQGLISIVKTIASKHGWAVLAVPEAINVTFQRITQNQETDLEFLHRLAEANNYLFSVRGPAKPGRPTQVIFYSRTAIESQPPVTVIARTDSMRGSFKAATQGASQIYKACTWTYFDSETKKTITATVQASPAVAVGDTLFRNDRVENGQDAAQKAKAALHQANMGQITGSITVSGDTSLAAGLVVGVTGFGAFNGNYVVSSAKHRIERSSAYTTEVELRSINAPADSGTAGGA